MLNKKMILSILLIGTIATMAGAGTWAAFTDTETSSDNTFTAGTLDLQLGKDGTNYASGALTGAVIADVYPGKTGDAGTIYVKNAGTVPGTLTWTATVASDLENTITDPESKLGDTAPAGELSSHVTLAYDKTQGITIAPGATAAIKVSYAVDNANNDIQSDSTSYNFAFTLTQA